MQDPEMPNRPSIHQDATEDDDRELIPRILIAPIAVIIVLMLVAIPVLTVLTRDDGDETRREAARDARGQVALFFSLAVLEARSNSAAERYVIDSELGAVRETIADLRRRDAAELEGATSTVERVACRAPVPDGECFRAWLARSGEPPVTEITFTVAIVDGTARVVSLGDPLTALGTSCAPRYACHLSTPLRSGRDDTEALWR